MLCPHFHYLVSKIFNTGSSQLPGGNRRESNDEPPVHGNKKNVCHLLVKVVWEEDLTMVAMILFL